MSQEFRPKKWNEFLGQEKIISNLKIFVESSIKQQNNLDHLIIHGPSGMGKTSLAYLISKVLKVKIHLLNGPNLQKQSDLISVLSSIKENEILFIDEIHAVDKEILEVLYPVLEDNKINLIIGKDYNSKIINIKLPPFTLIGATTELNKLPFAFINRFSINFELEDYSIEELNKIALKISRDIGFELDYSICALIALHCRNTPRIIVNLIKRINDFFIAEELKKITYKNVEQILLKMGIYKFGLTKKDIQYLNLLNENLFMGLETISQILNTSSLYILNFIEPLLLRLNFISRTNRGRKITIKGIEYLTEIKKSLN